MKIHAKTTLVVRREGDELKRYVHIGTGNYHATTARIYEDVGLFTADPDIAADVADLFNFVTGFGRPQQFRKILAAPFNLRRRLIEHIRAVAAAAEEGKTARIRIKVNNLTDADLVEELYRASQAGAQIDLIVRAICTLVPGVEGLSENIRVRSVLGRFLEHSRLFCFEAGDEKTYLLGSADLMPRNLDHRIEVVVPVEDAPGPQRARGDLQGAARPTTRRRGSCSADGSWERVLGEEERAQAPGAGPVHAPARARPPPRRGRTRGRRHVGSSPWRRAGGGRRRRLEHRAPARGARRAAGPLASARCCGSARTSSATAASPSASSRRQPRSSPATPRTPAAQASSELEVLITSPGRQAANGDDLLRACSRWPRAARSGC